MRFAICDDEKSMQKNISDYIAGWASTKGIQIDVFYFSSAEAFMLAWLDTPFDLVFLDIQMEKMTGIELAEYIRKTDKNMLIVFITNFAQHVFRGYDVDALHYLIKPITKRMLMPILNRAYTILNSRKNATLLVTDDNALVKLPFGDIYCISILSHVAYIQTANSAYKLKKTAEELFKLLPGYFIRCHRSCIVNLFKVDCVYKNSLLLSNGKTMPVSRSHTKVVNNAFIKLHTSM
jgi:DNA-binding LytR/AlgR family response regulator